MFFLHEQIDIFSAGYVDWAHTLLQDGVLNRAMFLFLMACKTKVSLDMDTLAQFLKNTFDFPKFLEMKSVNLWMLFDRHHLGGEAPTKLA